MLKDNKLWIAGSQTPCFLQPQMANRHGLITGATGTGKSVTLKVMAESFSDLGVPVFLADIKGDMSGICLTGQDSPKMQERIAKFPIDGWQYKSYPTAFFDVFGQKGHPIRVTVSEMGPLLLGRMMGLSDVQRAVLSMVFRIADDRKLLLLDMKDLRLMLQYVGDNASEFTLSYGNVSKVTIGTIQRSLSLLEDQSADTFFGEPAFAISDWMRTDASGRGIINILSATTLFTQPLLYSTFLLWLLSELFETLPEAGDLEKPKMVFFFDEAHLLFNDAPPFLIERVEQVIKLIRSKGVGVYFISQSPADIPEGVLAQLGNRVQHALRAYTPAEQKNIHAAAQAFRVNPAFDTETALTELGVGEALLSFLDEKGVPGIVERAFILPPQSFIGPAGDANIAACVQSSPLFGKYEQALDRESAYEMLMKKYEDQKNQEDTAAKAASDEAAQSASEKAAKAEAAQSASTSTSTGNTGRNTSSARPAAPRPASSRPSAKKTVAERAVTSALNSAGREIGRSLVRGLLGSFLK